MLSQGPDRHSSHDVHHVPRMRRSSRTARGVYGTGSAGRTLKGAFRITNPTLAVLAFLRRSLTCLSLRPFRSVTLIEIGALTSTFLAFRRARFFAIRNPLTRLP